MKMKGVRAISSVIYRYWIKTLIIGLFLGATGCQKEPASPAYRNVEREISLSELEKDIKESGFQIGKLIRAEQFKNNRKSSNSHKQLGDDETKIKEVLKPLIKRSKQLLGTYGISEDFLAGEFARPEDPGIVLAGLWFMAVEREGMSSRIKNSAQILNLGLFAQETSLTEAQPDWMDCMLTAVGVDAIVEFVKGNVTEAIAKKAIRKIASRTLGWVGVALALYEYGNCMDWY